MQRFPWGHDRRYNDYSGHFRKLFGKRVQKIALDTGFTCPNRDGTRGRGGCTYCNNQAFNPAYCHPGSPIADQLERGISFFSGKYPDMVYLAYFQAYTNTYAPAGVLKEMYEAALQHKGVIGLVIATRPDCVDGALLDYLSGIAETRYVMIEYGVESHLNSTLERINRGHTFEDSVHAIEETAKRNLHTCAHLILGLPGENRRDFIDQARAVSQTPVENLKLHQLQIHRGTEMFKSYRENPDGFHLFSVDEYADLVVDYLENLNSRIVVERFVSEAPPELLVAPCWGIKNFEFVAKVDKRLKDRDTWQGRCHDYSGQEGRRETWHHARVLRRLTGLEGQS